MLFMQAVSLELSLDKVKYKSKNWDNYEIELKKVGVKIIYFPYTKGTSSTLINKTLIKLRK